MPTSVTTNQPPLSSITKSRRLTFFGHLAQMTENADASQAIFKPPPENWRRPRTTWMKNIHDDLSSLDLWIHIRLETWHQISLSGDWCLCTALCTRIGACYCWRRGVVVSGVRRWTKLTYVGPGYNWDGWPSSGGYTISGCNQPTRSTQPCITPGSLNRVPASAGVKAGMSPLPGGR